VQSRQFRVLLTVGLVAYGVVHILIGWIGGLDDALRTVNRAPSGAGLLTLMALGLACFGIYLFAWARHPKVSTDTDKPPQI
jgi:hypothetical protein